MRKYKHRLKKKKYYVVSFISRDGGRKHKSLVRVPKGCIFLSKIRFGNINHPTYYKGHKVVGWVNVYSSDSGFSDEYAPIISKRQTSLLYKIFAWLRNL
jgi:hypothetical protein